MISINAGVFSGSQTSTLKTRQSVLLVLDSIVMECSIRCDIICT